ncbi:hypothetical protein [Wielerella bovis]|uniref:hypothetical protein n=1 Tax=Wielerella bovis TaxID=2917790 RepID=UPI00201A20B8|nr:hypothetical protein [Wielerella bovis]ULJ60067.1 hypothetical protein MIS44_10465 [Wielerella bovis]
MAQEYLNKNNCNPKEAWEAARKHRDSYSGLIEEDRNAEHYLHALDEVHNSHLDNKSKGRVWMEMVTVTYLYSGGKAFSNAGGHFTNLFYENISPFRGSPVTSQEIMAGLQGAMDGYSGSFAGRCKCKK